MHFRYFSLIVFLLWASVARALVIQENWQYSTHRVTVTNSGSLVTFNSVVTTQGSSVTMIYVGLSPSGGDYSKMLEGFQTGTYNNQKLFNASEGKHYVQVVAYNPDSPSGYVIHTGAVYELSFLDSQTISVNPNVAPSDSVAGRSYNFQASGAQGGNSYNFHSVLNCSVAGNMQTGLVIVTPTELGPFSFGVGIDGGNGYSPSEVKMIYGTAVEAPVRTISISIPANNSSMAIPYKIVHDPSGYVLAEFTFPPMSSGVIRQYTLPPQAPDGIYNIWRKIAYIFDTQSGFYKTVENPWSLVGTVYSDSGTTANISPPSGGLPPGSSTPSKPSTPTVNNGAPITSGGVGAGQSTGRAVIWNGSNSTSSGSSSGGNSTYGGVTPSLFKEGIEKLIEAQDPAKVGEGAADSVSAAITSAISAGAAEATLRASELATDIDSRTAAAGLTGKTVPSAPVAPSPDSTGYQLYRMNGTSAFSINLNPFNSSAVPDWLRSVFALIKALLSFFCIYDLVIYTMKQTRTAIVSVLKVVPDGATASERAALNIPYVGGLLALGLRIGLYALFVGFLVGAVPAIIGLMENGIFTSFGATVDALFVALSSSTGIFATVLGMFSALVPLWTALSCLLAKLTVEVVLSSTAIPLALKLRIIKI